MNDTHRRRGPINNMDNEFLKNGVKMVVDGQSQELIKEELETEFLNKHRTFAETSQGSVNPTELIAMLIAEGQDFVLKLCEDLKSQGAPAFTKFLKSVKNP